METETPEVATETKEDLEKEKLRLEIADLNKAWWKRPAYVAALFPTMLALTALIYGLANGYFQASFVKLENQKHDLQKEIDVFTLRKTELEQENQKLSLLNTELTDRNKELLLQKEILYDRVKAMTNDLSLFLHEKHHSWGNSNETEKVLTQKLMDLYDALVEFGKDKPEIKPQ